MKRYGNIYEKICEYDNLKLAHHNARKGKTWYKEVQKVDKNEEFYLLELQKSLINKTYKTSEYIIFNIVDKGKEREIYKLPYFPDRICQWAIMLQIERIIISTFTDFSCAAIPNKGIHYASNLLGKYMKNEEDTTYCLKMDIKKFFPNINHGILKQLLRKKFKDEDLLWLLDEIIDSVHEDSGIPIGNYISQYLANFYLTYFDHWLKEEKKLKYVIRYMDDIVILHHSKEHLHQIRKEIQEYLCEKLLLELKDNYQVFPTRVRGVDFVGYRHFGDYKLLRKTTAKQFKRKMRKINKYKTLSYSNICTINSYKGWLKWADCNRLEKKYIGVLSSKIKEYEYEKLIIKKHNKQLKNQKEWREVIELLNKSDSEEDGNYESTINNKA